MHAPGGENDRRWTDPRFPSLEIRNDGGPLFTVYEDGNPIDEFKAYEGASARARVPGSAQPVSGEFAARRAKAYFDRMAQGSMRDELADREPEPAPAQSQPSPGGRLNWTSRIGSAGPASPETPAPSIEFGSRGLDDLIARARKTGDPAAKKQALSWMNQESAAQRVVRLLLSR